MQLRIFRYPVHWLSRETGHAYKTFTSFPYFPKDYVKRTRKSKWCSIYRYFHSHLSRVKPSKYSLNRKSRTTINIKSIMSEDSDWLNVGLYEVYPWSVSGVESSIVVRGQNLSVAFDMGYPTRMAVHCPHVFISHGHLDHVSGLVHHAGKRALYGLKPATYYLPPHLVEPMRAIAHHFSEMHERDATIANLKLVPIDVGERVKLTSGWMAQAFPTVHSVPSQGYILYKQQRQCKPEYQHLTGPEIGQLVKEGVQVHTMETTPEIVYTGDTTFQVFENPSNPDILKVKLLITESTYIDDEVDKHGHTAAKRARDRGHCHLEEFTQNAQLFTDVKDILFVHFSDKYSVRYVLKQIDKLVPDHLKNKIHAGLLMKEKLG